MNKNDRKHLSADSLFSLVSKTFNAFNIESSNAISLHDCLMSGLAIFSLKYPSLLAFDKDRTINKNLNTLFKCNKIPSDTYLRERLDLVNPKIINTAYKAVFNQIQRGKVFENFKFLNKYHLVSLDGTGYFNSKEIHCENCCQKEHRDGTVSYYHQMLSGVFIHPKIKEVIPVLPEPIIKQDGNTKNDCERNAAKRFIKQIKKDHPKLPLMFVEDGLASNAPHIKLLKENNISFILGAKKADHKWLFDIVEHSKTTSLDLETEEKYIFLKFINNIELNESNPDVVVNFLECKETKLKGKQAGKTTTFTWVTDVEITTTNAFQLMEGARARWRIENETFNTLKNQGYHFEHNFGHGNKNLSTVFAYLMILAFLIDQVQSLCSVTFKNALAVQLRKSYLWKALLNTFLMVELPSWECLYKILSNDIKLKITLEAHSSG